MANTKAGGLKCAATNKKKYGDDFYRNIGRKGGLAPRKGPRGFAAMSPEKLREASAKGGHNSDRTGIKNGEGKKRRRSDEA